MPDLMLSALGNVFANAVLFLTIPFIWWLILHRKNQNFFSFIGYTLPKLSKPFWVLCVFIYALVA